MESLTIFRKEVPGKPTLGHFFIDSRFHAYSLEDRIRDEYVAKDTAIPYGRYEVVVTYSNRFKRQMPLIINVQGTDSPILFGGRDIGICGIRIHGGNTSADTEGCPIIGKYVNESIFKIWDCAVVFDPFLALLTAAVKTHKVFLNVQSA